MGIAGIVLALCVLTAAFLAAVNDWSRERAPLPDKTAFVTANGPVLVQNGRRVTLKSVSFSNYYTLDLGQYDFDLEHSRHHSEADFARVREIGFNSIRFAFNGNWFLTDPEAFWRWLDQNIGWAEKHGLMLILDLHVPIGGFWLAPNSADVDFRLWTEPRLWQANLDLWRAIAKRYENSTTIAAYEILNEPVTEDATGDQWRELAADLVRTIRKEDDNHLLIVGALYGTGRKYASIGEASQFLVEDDNVMYDFHFYQPLEFTHQQASWVDRPLGDGGTYPDHETLIPTGAQVQLGDSSIQSARAVAGDSEWKHYTSPWARMSAPQAVAGLPIIVVQGRALGQVFFDDVKVFEYDVASRTFRQVVSAPLTRDGIWQWWPWTGADHEDAAAIFQRSQVLGSNDRYSLAIDRPTPVESYWGWSSDAHFFRIKPGNYYKITGRMRGTGVAYPQDEGGEFIGFRLDFYSNPPVGEGPGFLTRDRAYLEREISKLLDFGTRNNVPMSVMEFGLMHQAFETPDHGGARWVSDVLGILRDHGASFSLWNYHGSSMGLYLSDLGSAPGAPNLALIEVLGRELSAWDTPGQD